MESLGGVEEEMVTVGGEGWPEQPYGGNRRGRGGRGEEEERVWMMCDSQTGVGLCV